MYHVLNRANARRRIFESGADYMAFVRILAEMHKRVPVGIVSWCLMPNHWHLVLSPAADGQLSDYMRLVALTHTQRWHAHRKSTGTGHLYQGRFKSFAVQNDAHFLIVCRYVEANALRAGLVPRAEDWGWSSISKTGRPLDCMAPWPVKRPDNWLDIVNEVPSSSELDSIRKSVQRGTPYGTSDWTNDMAGRLGLQSTLRPRGRPKARPAGMGKKGPDPF